jgi:uncharacterized integral membrane protein (TIGR00698 family)
MEGYLVGTARSLWLLRFEASVSVSGVTEHVRALVPGVGLLIGIAVSARAIAAFVSRLDALLLAIALSVLVANVYGTPEWAAGGVGLGTLFLETGIVLLGAELAIGQVVAAGPIVLVLAFGTVVLGVLYTEFLGRRVFDVEERTSSLVAAGSSVCGVSAVVATAESIEVTDEQIAYAASTVLLFDAITLLVFPIAGGLLSLPPKQFGLWAGLSMFSTGPVSAVGFAYAPVAGEWATLTKLVRNAFIGLVAVAYSIGYARRREDAAGRGERGRSHVRYLWNQFPKFIVGFVLVIAVANTGALSGSQIDLLGRVSEVLFLLAFAGIGFDIRIEELRSTGFAPVLVVLVHLLTASALALGAVVLLF